jgi:hypothetical protein
MTIRRKTEVLSKGSGHHCNWPNGRVAMVEFHLDDFDFFQERVYHQVIFEGKVLG